MTTTYDPQDTIIGPIIHQIALIISAQITGISQVYERPPEGPPEDNSVIIPLTEFKIVDETNGKLTVRLTFGVRHMLRRSSFPENITAAYTYFYPYVVVFGTWQNQTLGGLSRSISVTNGGVTAFTENLLPYVALIVNLSVLTEFNIPLT